MMNLLCVNFNSTIELTPLLTTFLSVFIVVAGWWYNQARNRKNEIEKEARNHRLEMLKSFMDLFCLMVEKNDLVEIAPLNEYGEHNHYIPPMPLWEKVYVQIKIYGEDDEIKLYKEIMPVRYDIFLGYNWPCITDEQYSELYERCEKLSKLCIDKIRKELQLKELKGNND
ncbi:hypothetical protein Barb4_00506 [Bacteroidales bacterium Barb4]|nr:hypothetical protein Barb4_00506 [Bacteroidales bacterium Barb4]